MLLSGEYCVGLGVLKGSGYLYFGDTNAAGVQSFPILVNPSTSYSPGPNYYNLTINSIYYFLS